MKYLLLLLLLLFNTNCTNNKEEEQLQILQKNSTFNPICKGYSTPPSPTCSDNATAACGTVPGSIDMLAYCIDSNDNILDQKPKCGSDVSVSYLFSLECHAIISLGEYL